ncbi:MFS transporter [Cryptosporangium arvum]|uniref:MFS transporter n=1 Tax=Cryptosporangium arvum TaxID=80871 RepID=UPI001470091C|nr:MFS transporter [Cryptosporangium arvum]
MKSRTALTDVHRLRVVVVEPTPAGSGKRAFRHACRHRTVRLTPFRTLWAAVGLSNLADGINVAAAPLLAATLTRDPAAIAGLLVAQRAPWLLSMVSGALVDRLDRRRILQVTTGVRALVLGLLALAITLGFASIPLLYVVFVVLGLCETLVDNASAALVPAIVPAAGLEKANGRIQTTFVVANEFAGPPVGGFLLAIALALPFAAGALGLVASMVVLLFLPRVPRAEPAARRSLWADIRDGGRWYWHSPVVRSLSFLSGVGNAMTGASYGLLVVIADRHLHLSPHGYGIMLAVGAVGAVVGGLVADRVARLVPPAVLISGTCVISAAAVAGLGFVTHPAGAAALLALDGFVVLILGVSIVSTRQRLVPSEMLGRVNAVYFTVALGGLAVGGLGGGFLARLALPLPFVVGAVAMLLTTVAVLPTIGKLPRVIDTARESIGE